MATRFLLLLGASAAFTVSAQAEPSLSVSPLIAGQLATGTVSGTPPTPGVTIYMKAIDLTTCEVSNTFVGIVQ